MELMLKWFKTRFREEIPQFSSRSFFEEVSEFCSPDFQIIEARCFGCLQVRGQVSPHRRSAVKCKFHDDSYRSYWTYLEQNNMTL